MSTETNSFSATPTAPLSLDSPTSPGHRSHWGSLKAKVPGITLAPAFFFSLFLSGPSGPYVNRAPGGWPPLPEFQDGRRDQASGLLALRTDASMGCWVGQGCGRLKLEGWQGKLREKQDGIKLGSGQLL